jgi:hypothetical protein
MKAITFAAALSLVRVSLPGAELETTHLFGFTLGSDVNDVGEIEGEVETIGRFTKRDGAYAALSNAAAIKFIPFQDFSIEPGIGLAYHDITGVPGFDDRVQWAYEATLLELRYRALNRKSAPFGLTFGMDPHWVRVDETSGEPIDRYGVDLLMIADRELIEDRMFGAFNLVYPSDATRAAHKRLVATPIEPRSVGGAEHAIAARRPGRCRGALSAKL